MKTFCASLLLLLSSCSYSWAPIEETISFGYIAGDGDGTLTAAIVRELSSSGYRVVSGPAPLHLSISIVRDTEETLGYRWDRQKVQQGVKKDIVATEGRKEIQLEVEVWEGSTLLLGPCRIGAESDFDYLDGDSIEDLLFRDPSGNTVATLPFSLGQLEPKEAAAEASLTPLHRKLAEKVVAMIWSKQQPHE